MLETSVCWEIVHLQTQTKNSIFIKLDVFLPLVAGACLFSDWERITYANTGHVDTELFRVVSQ